MRLTILTSLILCSSLIGNAFAATAVAPTTDTTTTKAAAKVDDNIVYCPPIKKMVKKGLFWGASGGWRSYAQSFVKELDTFVGAQWAGINVGKMLCIYKGKDELTFPVILQNDTLTKMPVNEKLPHQTKFNHWGKYEDGYVNCNSADIYDCPFTKTSNKLNMEQIYEQLDFYKKKEEKTGP